VQAARRQNVAQLLAERFDGERTDIGANVCRGSLLRRVTRGRGFV
jgi:hypothetical protein